MRTKTVKKQIRLTIASNAGGSGKTTVATHLAYAVGAKGYKVTLIELDQNGSLCIFARLTPALMEQSIASVFKKAFTGNYPLVPLWAEHLSTVTAIQGGKFLEESIAEIYNYSRRHYTLKDKLEDFPLNSDLIIFDTPASLEPMGLIALAACTHVLVPIKPEYKDTGSFAGFLDWFYSKVDDLRLKPQPEILGFVPTRVDLYDVGAHRDILGLDKKGKLRTDIDPEKTLPYLIEQMGIHCFPFIRESNYYLKASGSGLPLNLYRPGCDAVEDFKPIVSSLIKLMTEDA
ncbi:cobyrinic acid a,c-diamide synthase (plasmid) [Trichormus variabilis NIES-23]|uniref:Cobyrinic acid a,c-diamide synthase n=1 Tax=Trichormus variabilis NIES-23 TaxID=1973479 RepID=A0A1Z4KWR0_ANAVA|nr:cobyrinic acid a,c-diamide synthase [Trichormus variabilis NIES-23]